VEGYKKRKGGACLGQKGIHESLNRNREKTFGASPKELVRKGKIITMRHNKAEVAGKNCSDSKEGGGKGPQSIAIDVQGTN